MSDQSSTSNSQDDRLNDAFDQLESQTESKPTSGGSSMSSLLAIFLALIATGIASYPAYEIYKQKTGSDEQSAAIEARLTELTNRNQATQEQLNTITAAVGDAGARLDEVSQGSEEFRQYVTGELDTVRSSLGTSSQDWLYAEVEYLVRMANQRVLMEGDAVSALSLLSSADQIIQQAEGLAAHELRQSLAADIAALKAVNQVDVQGIYLQLSALVEQVDNLKRAVPGFEPEEVEETVSSEPQSTLDRISAVFTRAIDRFTSLVDFRRGGVTVTPILPPREEYYLRQNLILKLQIAQMALLEGNDEVYKTSLREASSWVASSFDEADAGTVAMIASLSSLAEKNVGVAMPDISRSLQAAREQLSGFHEAPDQ